MGYRLADYLTVLLHMECITRPGMAGGSYHHDMDSLARHRQASSAI
jgi:hypothetical protein